MVHLERHENTSDLTFICKRGRKAFAHQYLLGKHSPLLRELFNSHGRIGKIDLFTSKIEGRYGNAII